VPGGGALCVVSSAPPLVVALCVWPGQCNGGLASGRLLLALKRAVPVGMPGPRAGVYPGVCGVDSLSPGQMANVAPAQPEAHPDARCLCPGRYIHGPTSVVPRLPPSHWPMKARRGLEAPGSIVPGPGLVWVLPGGGWWPGTAGGSIS